MTIGRIVSREATQGIVRIRPAYRVAWKVLLFSGAVLWGGLAIASCTGRTGTTLTALLRQPILAGQHEVIVGCYREAAGKARLLAATHFTKATLNHTLERATSCRSSFAL